MTPYSFIPGTHSASSSTSKMIVQSCRASRMRLEPRCTTARAPCHRGALPLPTRTVFVISRSPPFIGTVEQTSLGIYGPKGTSRNNRSGCFTNCPPCLSQSSSQLFSLKARPQRKPANKASSRVEHKLNIWSNGALEAKESQTV